MPLNLPPPRAQSTPPAAMNGTVGLNESSSSGLRDQPSSVPAPSPSSTTDTSRITTASAVAATSSKPSTSSFLASLPPPKTKSKAAASGPKKFVLDLPKPTRSASELDSSSAAAAGLTSAGSSSSTSNDEPAAKRPKLEGLAGLLPDPTNKSSGVLGGGFKLPAPRSATSSTPSLSHRTTGTTPATSLLPHALKGKAKAPPAGDDAAVAPKLAPSKGKDEGEDGPEEDGVDEDSTTEQTDEPAVDFFGLGGGFASTSSSAKVKAPKAASAVPSQRTKFSAAPTTSAASTAAAPTRKKTTTSNSTTTTRISAAPTTSAPSLASNYYATLPLPSKSDPYPGFYQKPDGSWAAKRPEEWDIWARANGWIKDATSEEEAKAAEPQEPEVPKDFDSVSIQESYSVSATDLSGATVNGAAVARPSRIADEDKDQQEAKGRQKKFSHAARSRHQLSTLIADARDNRQELEDRISQAKANKRSGGAKYGF